MRQNNPNPQSSPKTEQIKHLSEDDVLHLKKLTLHQQMGYIKDLQLQHQYLQSYLSHLQSEQQKSDLELKELDVRIQEQKKDGFHLLERYDSLCFEDSKDINQKMEKAIQLNLRIFEETESKHEELQMKCLNAKQLFRIEFQKLSLRQAELDAGKMQEHKIRLMIAAETQKFMFYESRTNKLRTNQQRLFNNRKKLNNDLQEFKGNIRVFCRVRPRKTMNSVITTTSGTTLKLTLQKDHIVQGSQKYQQGYFFEQIFKQTDPQETVFTELLQLINNAIDGKNVCIFAYGQTGSGKTYTLLGPQSYLDNQQSYNNRGLAYRSFEHIFDQIHRNEMFNWKYNITLSIYEIYLDTIIDLIANTTSTMDGLVEIKVKNSEEVYAYVKKAISARKTSATNMNQRSSRSHLIITLSILGEMKNSNDKRNGSLVLVDLAGSERIKQSKVEGQALKQTLFINKSLSSLGTVINGIRRKSDHIPFRNSKLTHSLQPYLEGDSKTLMFINISPDFCDCSQTKISLAFAESVRECKINK